MGDGSDPFRDVGRISTIQGQYQRLENIRNQKLIVQDSKQCPELDLGRVRMDHQKVPRPQSQDQNKHWRLIIEYLGGGRLSAEVLFD